MRQSAVMLTRFGGLFRRARALRRGGAHTLATTRRRRQSAAWEGESRMADFSFDRHPAPGATSYHLAIGHLLERRFPELWERFDGEEARRAATAEIGVELGKRAAPIGLMDAPRLYEAAGEISRAMGLDAPLTFYRGAPPAGLKRNAAMYFDPEHAHVVLEGDLLDALEAGELWHVVGHELAHHRLWTVEGGRIWTAHRLLAYAAGERGSAPAFVESLRLDKLYTELFADRYGLWASGDLESSLRAHVKIAAGQDEASGAAYLADAEAALEAHREARADAPPPEPYLRAALMAAWAQEPAGAEARTRQLVEAEPPLDRLDLLAQERLGDVTAWMLYEFLGEPWRSRELIRGHAAEFSEALGEALAAPRATAEAGPDLDGLRAAITGAHASVRRYFAYVLLDFATVDPQIEEMALAAALQFAHDFGLATPFRGVAAQELKITKTKLADLEKNADEIIARAELLFGDPSAFMGGGGGAASGGEKVAEAAR